MWGALTSSGIFSETASTTMDTEDTLSLPESLRKEYHDLRAKVADDKMKKGSKASTTHEDDEGMKLQENGTDEDDDDDNVSVTSTISRSSSGCRNHSLSDFGKPIFQWKIMYIFLYVRSIKTNFLENRIRLSHNKCGRDVEELFSDSGLESGGSVDDVTIVSEVCDGDCFCARIREWLERMSNRSDNVANLDEYWRDEAEAAHKKPAAAKMMTDLSKYNLDPYPTLSRESYRAEHTNRPLAAIPPLLFRGSFPCPRFII